MSESRGGGPGHPDPFGWAGGGGGPNGPHQHALWLKYT